MTLTFHMNSHRKRHKLTIKEIGEENEIPESQMRRLYRGGSRLAYLALCSE